MSFLVVATGLALALAGQESQELPTGALEARLRTEDPIALARDARRLGDARRGAAVFYQPTLTCTKCHVNETGTPSLGPDLAALGKDVADAYLVEAILEPSKVIKKGYESVTISTEDGRILTGLLGEDRPDAVVLRDPGQDGKPVTIPKKQIEERKNGGASIMPAGLINNLGTRQQFLDLVRYLMEIAEKGPARARELKPDPALLAPAPLPESERDIDHAGLITSLDQESFAREEAIYNRVCINCHGTKDRLGSLPTSLRFASGVFKNGADPLSMYRTLTLGFGQMTPQSWMVPRQKYDVIHYIRAAYLKPHNPGQYGRVDPAYLARLPRGKSLGPEPVEIQPWVTMDYGPSLMATYEISHGDGSNIVNKGIAIRLDPGSGGISRGRAWAVYDQDTMRFAAAWTGQGFIDWNGINFNGSHQVHPRLAGQVQLANPNEPAWANPENGSFHDLRERGRDGRFYGPLPRRLVHYRGLYQHGEQIWTPKNRINWVNLKKFYHNMYGYTDVTDPSDSAMEQPVCWLTNAFDRSPAQLLWVETGNPAWKPLAGSLLCLSYGYGKIFVVPHEIALGQMQGGECALPIPRFPTGVMRGRFHPGSGQLYTCGLFGWAGDQTEPGGFYRVRARGKPMFLPIGLSARKDGMVLHFTEPLDSRAAIDVSRYSARIWSIKRTINYGSDHHGERSLKITTASLSADGRTVFLKIPDLRPTLCMEITYRIQGRGGEAVDGVIHNTIHQLGDGEANAANPAPVRGSATR